AGQLPADLVGTFEPRRKPEPEKPRRTPPPAAPAVAAAETVEAAIRALATPEADAKAHADRVADRVAESLREVAYRPFIKARARDAASGLIDPAKLARAFDVARRSTTAEKPGSILTKELRRLIGFDGRWQDLASHVASRNPAPTPPRLP
ncbi:MAG: hypothetical protein INR70_08830, partial [Parafilimonas terrae]|nr:hypothetical protein [Parafilimonas terrae]